MPLFGVALEIVSDKGYNLNCYFFNKAILILLDAMFWISETSSKLKFTRCGEYYFRMITKFLVSLYVIEFTGISFRKSLSPKLLSRIPPEAYLEPSQISTMELFVKIVNG